MLVMGCFLAACQQRSPESIASDTRVKNVAYPTKLIDIHGWHGIQVTNLKVNTWVECHFSFPSDFGSTQEEKSLLVYILTQRATLNDENCQSSVMSVYQALDQLLRIATNKQDGIAAGILLFQNFLGVMISLDGEIAEGYMESYVVPVLEKFDELNGLLDQSREIILADNICTNLQQHDDLKNPAFKKRIQVLIKRLNTKGMGRFARRIERCDLSRPVGQ